MCNAKFQLALVYNYFNATIPKNMAVHTSGNFVCLEETTLFHRPEFDQVLAGGNQQALAVALAAGLDFIRAEGFVFSHVADEGLMNACAGELLRYRKRIGADNVNIFTDIKKKHW